MLVLTRKKGQRIVVGDDIYITVLDVKGEQVQIGVDAPREISIHREEVYEDIQAENLRARESTAAALQAMEQLLGQKKKDGKGGQ